MGSRKSFEAKIQLFGVCVPQGRDLGLLLFPEFINDFLESV